MPRKACTRDGRPGYKWGDSGYCYTYTPGDEASRNRAIARCMRQARAIEASKHRRGG